MTHRTSKSHFAEPILVAFCGGKGHGKGTAAEILTRKYAFDQIEFADGLRKTVATALRCDVSWFTDPATKEEIDPRTGKSRRYWLQWIGTEGFRALWENVWVSWWSQEIEDRGRATEQLMVTTTDLRFPNELEAVRRMGERAIVIRVTNPHVTASSDAHLSEAHYTSFAVDYDITNDGTIRDLHRQVEDIVWEHFPKTMKSHFNRLCETP